MPDREPRGEFSISNLVQIGYKSHAASAEGDEEVHVLNGRLQVLFR